MVTPISRATSGSKPMMTNSPVPMENPPTPSASTARTSVRSSVGAESGDVEDVAEVADAEDANDEGGVGDKGAVMTRRKGRCTRKKQQRPIEIPKKTSSNMGVKTLVDEHSTPCRFALA